MALYRPELWVQSGYPGDYTCTFKVAFYVESDAGATTQVIISRNWNGAAEGIVFYWDNTADQASIVWFTGGGGTFEQTALASRPAVNDQCIGYLQSSSTTVKGGWALLSSPSTWVSGQTPNPLPAHGTDNAINLTSNANGALMTAQNWCGWNEVLSESTLSGEVYSTAVYRTNLVFELKLNDGDVTSPWTDTSGNGNNATQQGGLAPTDRANFLPDVPGAVFRQAPPVIARWAVTGRGGLIPGVKLNAPIYAVDAANPDVSLALTGVSATGQVGTVKSSPSYALTGNQATGQVGTATNAVSYALTGVAGTGQVGTVVSSITYALTGNQASGQIGSVTASLSYALSGNQATGQVGTVGNAVAYALNGVQATGQVGDVGVPGDVTRAITGVEATGQVGNVTASTGGAVGGYYDYDKPKKKRWLIKVGTQTVEVGSLKQATKLLDKLDKQVEQAETAPIEAKEAPPPVVKIIERPTPQEVNAEPQIDRLLDQRIAQYNAAAQAVARLIEEMDDEEAILMLL